jgi:hypothetical protein
MSKITIFLPPSVYETAYSGTVFDAVVPVPAIIPGRVSDKINNTRGYRIRSERILLFMYLFYLFP